MERFTLADETVVSDGRELSGAEIDALIGHLQRARLAALWRGMKRGHPLGAWVRSTRTPRTSPDQVVGYRYGAPPPTDMEHRLRVRTARSVDVLLRIGAATRARPPQVGQ